MKKYIKCEAELDDRFAFSFDEIDPEFWLKTTAENAKIYLEDERVIGNGAGMEYDVVIAVPRDADHWQMVDDIQDNLDRHVQETVDGTDYYGSATVTENHSYPRYANIPDDVYEDSVFYSAIIEVVPYDNIGPDGEYGIDFGVEDIESSKKIDCDDSAKSYTSTNRSKRNLYVRSNYISCAERFDPVNSSPEELTEYIYDAIDEAFDETNFVEEDLEQYKDTFTNELIKALNRLNLGDMKVETDFGTLTGDTKKIANTVVKAYIQAYKDGRLG